MSACEENNHTDSEISEMTAWWFWGNRMESRAQWEDLI